MSRSSLGSAVSAAALASLLAGCAAPGGVNSAAALKVQDPKLGFATRAVAALNASDFVSAAAFAEQAVEKTPDDADLRALLGNAYFGAGRFASADAAYRDALRLDENQPKVLLKLALVDIAMGKTGEANAFLEAARPILDPADYGLGIALTGRVTEAVDVLEAAARTRGADARVRQNLALALALAGDWNAARTVAAQDVPADQLDARIQDWMRLTSSKRPTDQIAALTGVNPAASDPGQPVRLALSAPKSGIAVAEAQPAAIAPVLAEPAVHIAEPGPALAYVPPVAAAPVAPQIATPVPVAAPFVEVRPSRAATAPKAQKPSKPVLRPAAFVPQKVPMRPAVLRSGGKSAAVVQLGAYGSPRQVATAWNGAARRYSALRAYTPVSARFQSAKGTVYRLSVKGFHSPDQAKTLCMSLRRSGGSCFVRNVAGDAPVQLASR